MIKTDQWRLHLQQWTTSGLSAEAFAQRNALSPRALRASLHPPLHPATGRQGLLSPSTMPPGRGR